MCLLVGDGIQRDLESAIEYFRLSAEGGSQDGQAIVGWMIENDIGTDADFAAAARYYELSADHSPIGAVRFGWCCKLGRGVPIDFTIAAESFLRAAELNDADGANSIGCCLEIGNGVEANIELAAHYYNKAASHSHPAGTYNFGRCLEYGLGVDCDLVEAAQYYRKAAEFGDSSAQNSFGVFLEAGIGIRSNMTMAAHYYEQSAMNCDSDGANNFGFCLEHGRGVEQNIKAASEWYRFAKDHKHPEGEVNYRRRLRLLDRWTVPDRSSQIADRPKTDDVAQMFIDSVEDSKGTTELTASIERLKETMLKCGKCSGPTAKWKNSELSIGNSSVVTLTKDRDGTFLAVKTAKVPDASELIRHEIAILKDLNHPLVIRLRESSSGAADRNPFVATELVANGSLADHLPGAENGDRCQLRD
jgi:TPR repeat protein